MISRAAVALAFALSPLSAQTVQLPPATDSLPHEFTRVGAVRELANDSILVTDTRERELYVAHFGSGTISRIGRPGAGPGEYRSVSRLLPISGDSSLLVDQTGRRWLLLAGSRVVATLTASDSVVVATEARAFAAGPRGQVLAVMVTDRVASESDRRRERLAIVRANRRTGTTDTVATLNGLEWQVSVDGPPQAQRTSSFEVQLSVPEQALMFPDGWIALARQEPYRIDWLSPNGALTRGPDLGWPSPPVGAEEVELFRQQLERQLGRPIQAPLTGMPFVKAVPPFRLNALLHWGPNELLVARQPWTGSKASEYDIIDRRGSLAARLRLPGNVRIVGVGARFVYTASVDADGIERVRRHRREGSR